MKWIVRVLARRLALDEFDAPENQAAVRAGLALAGLAMLLRIVFWAVANRYWEDAFITCLHSENFASGLGLTHVRPGEPPLHGFTSPLSVLVPLVGDMIRVGFGLEFIKLVSIPAAALTVVYTVALGIHPSVRLSTPLTLMVAGVLAVEHHQILFGMAGMETQIATLILVMSFYYTVAWKPLPLGISLGLCMLVRPDFAFWTVIVGLHGLLHDPKRLFKVVVPVALALYLPWIVFTTLYYGSPVPNTIIAKGLGYSKWYTTPDALSPAGVAGHAWRVLSSSLLVMLGPTFCGHGAFPHIFLAVGGHSPVGLAAGALALAGAALCATRRWRPLWPVAGFAAVYTLYYVFLVPIIFLWYKMPYVASLSFLVAVGTHAVTGWMGRRAAFPARTAVALAWVGLFCVILPWTFLTERQIDREIGPLRREAGLYLRRHMAPDEAVGGESLGYTGYYSRGNVYDWPGLSSRKVVEWSRSVPQTERSMENMLKSLRPEYLLLRDVEVLYTMKMPAWLTGGYHPVAAFILPPDRAGAIRWLEGSIDTAFRIYRKNPPGEAPPALEVEWPSDPPEGFRFTSTLYAMGMHYAQRKMPGLAAAQFRRVVELAPDALEAWRQLAAAYLNSGQRDLARSTVQELQRRFGVKDPVLLRALGD